MTAETVRPCGPGLTNSLLQSLRGAGKLLSMGKVKNVILRLHAKSHSPETQGNNRQIIQLLLSYG